MTIRILVAFLSLASCLAAGCSAGVGMMGEDPVDVSWLDPGVPRADVLARLGEPLTSRRDEQWRRTDHHDLVTGKTNTVGHLAGQLTLDVLTLGVWEVWGPSVDWGADREEWDRTFIYYTAGESVADVSRLPLARD
jgi:hypothetical protein